MEKNKLIVVLIAIFIIFAAISFLNTASAISPVANNTNNIKSIDKNSVMMNMEKSLSWEAKIHSPKKVVVKNIKTDAQWEVKTTTKIETYKKNKLKLTTLTSRKSLLMHWYNRDDMEEINKTSNVKYVKSKLNPKNYYSKVYLPKITKTIASKVTFDRGSAQLVTNNSTTLKFNADSYKNGKVVVYKKYTGQESSESSIITIEKYKTNKLKVTTVLSSNKGVNKQVTYLSTKRFPKEYYLKVLKPKIVKELAPSIYFDRGEKSNNDKKNPLWTVWSASLYFDSSVHYSSSIINIDEIGLPGGGYFITIEKVNNNKLKITYEGNGVPVESSEIVKTKYSPQQYFLKVFKKEKHFPY